MIECPSCNEIGCEDCDGKGYFVLSTCPREYVSEMVEAINMAAFSDKGCFPVSGGLLDQSCSYLELVGTLDSEASRVASENADKVLNG